MYTKYSCQHFKTDEQQDKCEAFLQMVEFMQYILNQEEECSQAHDSKYVGCEYDKHIL